MRLNAAFNSRPSYSGKALGLATICITTRPKFQEILRIISNLIKLDLGPSASQVQVRTVNYYYSKPLRYVWPCR